MSTTHPDAILSDYVAFRRYARRWARIALQHKRAGLPWHEAAQRAHIALAFALAILA